MQLYLSMSALSGTLLFFMMVQVRMPTNEARIRIPTSEFAIHLRTKRLFSLSSRFSHKMLDGSGARSTRSVANFGRPFLSSCGVPSSFVTGNCSSGGWKNWPSPTRL